MTPQIVVDIGNSRMKWGRVEEGRIVDMVALDPRLPNEWKRRINQWNHPTPVRWAVAGVVPESMSRFIDWLNERRDSVMVVIQDPTFPIITTLVDDLTKVGVDRLLNSAAAKSLAPPGVPVAAISVGTAMTIDFVDGAGIHIGGAILPGPRLMAASLNEHTAKLPFVNIDVKMHEGKPGRNTEAAIRAGIGSAIVGAAEVMIRNWAVDVPPWVFATGGDVDVFQDHQFTAPVGAFRIERGLTLEGVRLAAEARA